jgi:predicted esterase
VTDDARTPPHVHHLRVRRTARYYTLGGDGGTIRDVWLVLHGYSQLAGVFVRFFTDLASSDSLVIAAEALNRFYLVGPDRAPAGERPVGATWMTREDRASEIADYVEYLDGLYDDVIAEHVRAGARLHVLGFSQGAATATRWLVHGCAPVHRLVLWGGLLPPETDVSSGNTRLREAALTIVIGTSDQYIDDDALGAERARLDAAGLPYELVRFEGGHVITRTVFPRLREPASASDR